MWIAKTILYSLVLATSIYIGYLFSFRSQKRVEELKDFKSGFTILKTKIRFTYEPLGEIFWDISKSIQSKSAEVFLLAQDYMKTDDATNSWSRAIAETKMEISEEDKKAILHLGKLLGKTDVEGQMSEIDVTLTFLESQIQKAEEEHQKNEKLYKTLGTVLGIGMVIILL